MFLTLRFYLLMLAVIAVVALGFGWAPLFTIGRVLVVVAVLLVAADCILLWGGRRTRYIASLQQTQHVAFLRAFRQLPERFSNGDDNEVRIRVESSYGFTCRLEVVDEVPFVFQRRNVCFRAVLPPQGETTITYSLRPTERGTYSYGLVRLFAATRIGLVQRRVSCCEPQEVKVYPSFLMLRQYELAAMSNKLTEMGIKRIRRIGHNTDFEQIRDYVEGDDYRTINWRATARRSRLQVNVYQEERAQQVYCVIDKGRMMQVSSANMTLLDYSINAALALSFVAMNKHDKAGLITFSTKLETFVAASRQPGHLQTLQEALYAERAVFGETDYSALVAGLWQHVSHRSLIVLFTSFTSMAALRRQLAFLRQVASRHRLLVVFFEDEELLTFSDATRRVPTGDSQRREERGERREDTYERGFGGNLVNGGGLTSTEDYYQKVMAEKFVYDQRLIVGTLRQYGIQSLLTVPARLSIDVINRYITTGR